MKQIYNSIILLAVVVVIASCSPSAKVTIVVLDEDNNPIEGAEVYVFRDGPGGVAPKGTSEKGLSDSKGQFVSKATNYNNYVAYGARKEGYYDSRYEYQFHDASGGRWQPWNPELTVLLRKIENPVPMYVRNTQYARENKIELPVVGEKVGFDLIAYDWVPPYGNGIHADFIFSIKRTFVAWDDQDCNLEISFSGEDDGIQKHSEYLKDGSRFKLPRFAPKNGYEKRLKLWIKAKPTDIPKFKTNMKFDDNYLFRIRSTKDKYGRIKALYGKIRGQIWFDAKGNGTARVSMKYYVNPDHSRNLEFDPKRNLFSGLTFMEVVNEP